ncbi:MAG: 50S ribosomal protein L21 [Chloroflexi bacterium]|nr:50S ribosomal protein L21 [Chloroflexota bacterium]
MYAVIESGGKQHKVRPGDTIDVERLEAEAGSSLTLDRVLLVADDDNVQVGTPLVAGATVAAEVVEQKRGPKIIVFKYKAKVRYRKKQGHRQSLTTLKITDIQGASQGAKSGS